MRTSCERLVLENCKDVVSTEKQEFLTVYLDLSTAELAIKYLVTNFDIESNAIAILIKLASSNCKNLTALRKLLSCGCNVETRGCLLLFWSNLYEIL